MDNADDIGVFDQPFDVAGNSGGQATEPVRLVSFLPQSNSGSIVFTSRSEDVVARLIGNRRNIIKVGPIDDAEGSALCRKKLDNEYDEESILELLAMLDSMPLAITQAVAYINRLGSRGSIFKYLLLFRKSEASKTSLLHKDEGDLRRDGTAKNSIIVTWQMSFEQIRRERQSAADLLSIMSFFNRQGIPEFALRNHVRRNIQSAQNVQNAQNTQNAQQALDEEVGIEEDIAVLRGYCLLATTASDDVFEMYRLVQLATRVWLDVNHSSLRWRNEFLQILSEEFPTGHYEHWSRCQLLFPHAEAAATEQPSEKEDEALKSYSQVLTNAAWYAKMVGKYQSGEYMARKAVEVREGILGSDHTSTLDSLSILALVLRSQGKYEAAEEINRRALEGYEKVLERDHPDTLTSVSNLAEVLRHQGKY